MAAAGHVRCDAGNCDHPSDAAGTGKWPLAGLGPFSTWTPIMHPDPGAAVRTAKAGSLLKGSVLFKMAL